MRTAGMALLGFLGGAAAGFILASLLIILWYDVLGIGDRGGDGMNGMAAFIVITPLVSLAGGIAGAILVGRKAGAGAGAKGAGIAVAAILGLFLVYFLFSGMFI